MSEQPTFSQIDQQFESERPATVLVERSDGSITPGQTLGRGEHGARVFFANLEVDNEGSALPTKVVGAEKLTDSHQEVLAAKLAGVALLGIEEPPKAEFDAEAANLNRAYNEALEEKARAQRDGRGEDSIYWGQQAGQYSKQLSQRKK